MISSKRMLLGLAGFIAFGSFQASADVLAQYTFDDGLGGSTLAAESVDPGIVANDVVLADFNLANLGDFSALIGVDDVGPSLDLSQDFLSFTLDGGANTLNISEVSFEWGLTDAPGFDFDVYLLSSATGFATSNVISTSGALSAASTATNPPGFAPFTLDVSVDTSGIAGLQGVSGPVEFRIYVTDSITSGPGHFIDDISVEGVAVPEPGSLALLGLGGLCLFRRRRSV